MATDVTFVTNIDLSDNELRNAKLHILSTDPADSPPEGQFIYNSTAKQLKFFNGSTWVTSGAAVADLSGQASAFGQSAANGSATTAARSDHYHALPAHNAAAHSSIKLSDLAAPSANLAMAGFKLTGLAAGSANGDSLRYEQVLASSTTLISGLFSATNPVMNGTAGVGSSAQPARSDHVHPSDTSRFSATGSFYLGTTSVPINRSSGALSLNGVSIDGSAGSATNATNIGVTDDTTTNATMYPVWVTANTGNLPAKVSSTKLTYNPSSGALVNSGSITSVGYLHVNPKAAQPTIIQVPPAPSTHNGMSMEVGLSGSSPFKLIVADPSGATLTTLQYNTSNSWQVDKPLAMGSQKITGLADGTAATDAATVGQVQAAAQGLDVKQSVRAAVASGSAGTYNNAGGTSGNGQFTAAPQVVDGVTLVNGDRVLVIGSATSTGIYTVITAGSGSNGTWNRAADFDSQADVTPNSFVFVEEGSTYADSGWVLTTDGAITVGGPVGTVLMWTQFTGAGQITAGSGLTKTGNTLDVGAGTGISVAADTVAIDTAVVARKYSVTLGAAATSHVITHNLNTQDVNVTVRKLSDQSVCITAWEATSVNTVTVYFATATGNTHRVTVMG